MLKKTFIDHKKYNWVLVQFLVMEINLVNIMLSVKLTFMHKQLLKLLTIVKHKVCNV